MISMKSNTKTIHDDRYRALIDRLVEIRKSKNISQRELATRANVSHCCIGRIETYERRVDLIEFCDLCNILGISESEIIKMIQLLLMRPQKL